MAQQLLGQLTTREQLRLGLPLRKQEKIEHQEERTTFGQVTGHAGLGGACNVGGTTANPFGFERSKKRFPPRQLRALGTLLRNYFYGTGCVAPEIWVFKASHAVFVFFSKWEATFGSGLVTWKNRAGYSSMGILPSQF